MPFIIHPRRRNITMPQPFLHLGNVGLIGERVGGGCRPHGMHTDARHYVNQADVTSIPSDDVLIDRDGMQGLVERFGPVILDWPEEGAFEVLRVPGCKSCRLVGSWPLLAKSPPSEKIYMQCFLPSDGPIPWCTTWPLCHPSRCCTKLNQRIEFVREGRHGGLHRVLPGVDGPARH